LSNPNTPPYFHRKSVDPRFLYRDIGRSAERPFMIFASLLETSLGDLLAKITFLSSLKEQFDHARLIVRYADVRPYTAEIVSLASNIDHATPIKGQLPKWLAEYVTDMRAWLPLGRWVLGREKLKDAFYDLVVIDSMMDARNVHGFEKPAILRIPPEREDALHRQLVQLGLDPTRWYATLHYRTSSYGPKRDKSPIRNGDPESYRQLTDYIIDELGGQVVQLGHPEMEPFPARPGFVDLSRLRDGFMAQVYAVCHSRFLVAGPSGPVAMGWAFQVPTAVVDATDGYAGWGDAEQVVLTHEIITPEGKALRNRTLFEAGLLDKVRLNRELREGVNYQIRKNSGEELKMAAHYLLERTSDTTRWRPALQRRATPRPNCLIWPLPTHENMRFLGE
jgi:putative glycosyltransferase (TIGR04372 family)